jgi:hypothetical protein
LGSFLSFPVVHIASEVVLLGAMGYYFYSRCSSLESQNEQLKARVQNLEMAMNKMFGEIQQSFSQIQQVRYVAPPPQPQPRVHQAPQPPTPAQPPQPPQAPQTQQTRISPPEPRAQVEDSSSSLIDLGDECDKILEEEGI